MTGSLWDHVQARRGDPATSFEAWLRANRKNRNGRVASIMCDGVQRTDEEIHQAAQDGEWYTSRTSICQGRKALQRMGHIEDSGVRRRTHFNRESIVWEWVKQ